MMNRIRVGIGLGLLMFVCGCAASRPTPPVSGGEPLGLQMVRSEAQLKKYPFFTLLSFEHDADTVFVSAEGLSPQRDPRSHTGASGLALDPGTRSLSIRLGPLHSGRTWPGDWTLVGAYFYTAQPQRITATYEADGAALVTYRLELPAGRWTPVMLDISAALEGRPSAEPGTLRLSFADGLSDKLWCDDVLEMNNAATLVDADGWSVRESGFRYIIQRQPWFRIVLKTPEAAEQGWRLEEVNEIRARFASDGKDKSMTLYADGRQIVDGTFQTLVQTQESRTQASAHAAPGTIAVAAEMGRADRNTPGDANNDGYAELTGAYTLVANGARMELTITPQAAPLIRPVLQIRDLPAGKILVTMEGRLVDKVARRADGQVLVELPGVLQRSTAVNVRVNSSWIAN